MKYISATDFRHDSPALTGVLLVNLGTPDAPDPRSVRRYLKEFLMDPRVVEIARPLWWLVLNGIILNTRPARSARAYAKVWGDKGSPLLQISLAQQAALGGALEHIPVELAMRYGQPSIPLGLEALRQRGARRILVCPLYPQYSATTTASVFDAVTAALRRWRWIPELRFINQYHDDPGYIHALAESVQAFQADQGRPDLLLMSFHGIPREYFDKGDPYYCHCQKTARLLAEELNLGDDDYRVTFQSRLGPKDWLQPYTDETLKTLPAEGIRNIQVMCPGFSADCLETLEEIAMENKSVFMEAGGRDYQFIPCLNDRPSHISALSDLIHSHIDGWDSPCVDTESTIARAQKLGARH